MKVVILAGGMGSRLSEETQVRPKPMVEIGPYPILWHIMRHYSHYGLNDFIICLGYKGYVIKEYFANYVLHRSDILVDVEKNRIEYLGSQELPPWRISLVDTGAETMTGGRLKRIAAHLPADEPFCMTYGEAIKRRR
jgi:glucose-1-phosphate cytidylyltransferase